MPYITLNEIKNYLEIISTDHDARLANLANFACAVVESYVGYEISSNNYTEYHNGGKAAVFTKRMPVNNVQVVAEYDGTQYVSLVGPNADGSLANVAANANAVAEYTWTEEGMISKGTNDGDGDFAVSINGPCVFANYPKGVKIVYGAGYTNTTVPYDIKLATLDYVKILHKQTGEHSIQVFQGESAHNFPLTANFPPHIRRLLDFHRKIM